MHHNSYYLVGFIDGQFIRTDGGGQSERYLIARSNGEVKDAVDLKEGVG
jgi:hypothetical protein